MVGSVCQRIQKGNKPLQQTLTAKLQILPDERQCQVLLSTMRAYADACSCVAQRIHTEDIPLSTCRIHKAVYRDLREAFGLRSQMAESVIKTVTASCKSIRTSRKEHPERFRKDKQRPGSVVPVFRKPQLDLVWNRDYSLLQKNGERLFSVNTLEGRIKLSFRADAMKWAFDEGAKFGTAKLVFRHGKFFLHVPVTLETEDLSVWSADTEVVGIDRGIRFLTVSYDGKKTSFASGKTVKQKRAHYKKLRQDLQKKQTPSSRRRLKAIGQREHRWMNDVNHCLSKALALGHPQGTLFVLEDLKGIRSATERIRTKDRYVSVSWSYYDLEQKLRYKAMRNRCTVIAVDPAFTSQICPVCGHRDKKNRRHEKHQFCCKSCGYTSNDDRIAAMNLQRMGKEYLLKTQVPENGTAPVEHASPGRVQSITPRCAASPDAPAEVSGFFTPKVGDDRLLPLGRHKLANSFVSS